MNDQPDETTRYENVSFTSTAGNVRVWTGEAVDAYAAGRADERQRIRQIGEAYWTDDDSRRALTADLLSECVTGVEVIHDRQGRMLALYDVVAELAFQDDGRTLKVFLRNRVAGDVPGRDATDGGEPWVCYCGAVEPFRPGVFPHADCQGGRPVDAPAVAAAPGTSDSDQP